jgi:glycosyltransferase involved in cell wall biosynthesis
VRQDAGIVVPSDDVEAMAAAVVTLLGDEELRQRLGSAAQSREAAEHSLADISAELRAVVVEAAHSGSALS